MPMKNGYSMRHENNPNAIQRYIIFGSRKSPTKNDIDTMYANIQNVLK